MKTKTEPVSSETPSEADTTLNMTSKAAVNEEEEDEVSVPTNPNDLAALREICSANGLNIGKLRRDGPNQRSLEMFFHGMPEMRGLDRFPNLTELCIMYQDVPQITGLEACAGLQRLWICECKLEAISGLEQCRQLRHLFLYSNRIRRIAGLERQALLERLWLNNNQIERIEGLSHMVLLEELNLSANAITRLGKSLDLNRALVRLHLSGNRLCSFKELINLSRLPNLTSLNLKDPQYGPNPACQLANYAVYLLYHLPQLERLDSFQLAPSRQPREIAESVTLKKKMFYFMKSRAIKRTAADMAAKLRVAREEALRIPYERMRTLIGAMKELERMIRSPTAAAASGDTVASAAARAVDVDAAEAKLNLLRDRLAHWQHGCRTLDRLHDDAQRHVRRERQLALHLQQLELESGGNVKFEEGTSSDQWVRLVSELLSSRFCVQEFRHLGVVGIRAHRVLRLHNRLLASAYERRLADEAENQASGEPAEEEAIARRQQEFLFWAWEETDLEAALQVLEEGFEETIKAVPNPNVEINEDEPSGGLALTNSVNIADRGRVRRLMREAPTELDDECPFRVGRLLICKTFVGRSVQVARSGSAGVDRLRTFVPGRHLSFHRHQRVEAKLVGAEVGVCDCHSRQLEWHLFESSLALPEYLVEFEYVTRSKPASPFHQVMYADHGGLMLSKQSAIFDLKATETDVLSLPPRTATRSLSCGPSGQLSEQALLAEWPEAHNLSTIAELNLHQVGLQRLGPVQECTGLRRLIVSFNELVRLDEVSDLPLEVLDASHNRLQTMDGMRNMVRLKQLDISWNRLHNSREDVSLLRKHAPGVTHLQVHHNHWQKGESLRLRIIGRMKSLIKLDDQTVTEAEAAAAMRMAAGSRISQTMMSTYSRTDTTRLRSFSLLPTAQALYIYSNNKVDRASLDDPSWFLRITSLSIDSQHISKISNLERLENLRYASFDDNDITRIEGLGSCVHLEELSLEDNCIARLEGLERLTRLKRLFLANNYISSLTGGGLDSLNGLQLLAVENNRLTSLRGLERCNALLEVYAANNRVGDTREIFYLKGLPNLLILDLFGNGLTSSSTHYRPSVIFHLKTLKALDGRPIDAGEANHAKELLGGKLTCDFLIERLGHDRFYEIRELDFPSSAIRSVELSPAERFINLRSVNLERNNLSHLSGLIHLTQLKVLCLNYNHVESMLPRPVGGTRATPAATAAANAVAAATPIGLDSLEVLHLACNGIKDLHPLQLHRLPSLRALFLQGNELTGIEGLENLYQLRELVLDRNKIKALSENVLAGLSSLQELHLEENRLRGDLVALTPLGASLERLFLGANRIQDLSEVERLEALPNLTEVSLVNNTVARRMLHRPLLIHRLPRLLIIDGVPITEEERDKTELYFSDQPPPPPPVTSHQHQQQQPQVATGVQEVVLPSIGSYKTSNIKVTNVHLAGEHANGYVSADLSTTTNATTAALVGGSVGVPGGIRSRPMLRHQIPPAGGGHRAVINGNSGHMYYYDPSGHVEPIHGRWGAARNRK